MCRRCCSFVKQTAKFLCMRQIRCGVIVFGPAGRFQVGVYLASRCEMKSRAENKDDVTNLTRQFYFLNLQPYALEFIAIYTGVRKVHRHEVTEHINSDMVPNPSITRLERQSLRKNSSGC